jgi:hypothetical protein
MVEQISPYVHNMNALAHPSASARDMVMMLGAWPSANVLDQRVDENVEPAPQVGFQLVLCGERDHRSARVHDELDLI